MHGIDPDLSNKYKLLNGSTLDSSAPRRASPLAFSLILSSAFPVFARRNIGVSKLIRPPLFVPRCLNQQRSASKNNAPCRLRAYPSPASRGPRGPCAAGCPVASAGRVARRSESEGGSGGGNLLDLSKQSTRP